MDVLKSAFFLRKSARTVFFGILVVPCQFLFAGGDSLVQYNQFGSYKLFINGLRGTVQTDRYNFSADYHYRNYNGYRVHSNDYSNNFNLSLETTPSVNTTLQILGLWVSGEQKRPGSLTLDEFKADPYAADQRAINRDDKRVTQSGQANINYSARFGPGLINRLDILTMGRIEHFIRCTKEYKIISRYALSAAAGYTNTSPVFGHGNEVKAGGSIFFQPDRKEEYENFSGQQSDQLEQIKSEKSTILQCYLSDEFALINRRLYLALTGNYEEMVYSVAEETLPARQDQKRFHALTPQVSLTWKINRGLSAFASWGIGFRSPTVKELDSPDPAVLYNQALEAQVSGDLAAGVTGSIPARDSADFCSHIHYTAKVFRSRVEKEIVAYEIYGEEYFRNATLTRRVGATLQAGLEIVTGLTFDGTVTFDRGIYQEYTANSPETDSAGNIVPVYRDFSGNRVPNRPEILVDLELGYNVKAGKKTTLFADTGYRHAAGLWVDDANTDKTASYDLLHSGAAVEVRLGHLLITASGGVDNMLDQVYVGLANINSADRRYYDAGAPRNFYCNAAFYYIF